MAENWWLGLLGLSSRKQRTASRALQVEALEERDTLPNLTRELQEANLLLQQRTRELERLALTDPLTGLFNRRAIDEMLSLELKRRARYPNALTVGYVDVDHFKRVNT